MARSSVQRIVERISWAPGAIVLSDGSVIYNESNAQTKSLAERVMVVIATAQAQADMTIEILKIKGNPK